MKVEEREKAEAIIAAADQVLDTLPETMAEMLATLTRIEDKLDYWGGMMDEDE
jgi:uncharacterized coiled-coil protein SlyX